jgi:hypothetical protein
MVSNVGLWLLKGRPSASDEDNQFTIDQEKEPVWGRSAAFLGEEQIYNGTNFEG